MQQRLRVRRHGYGNRVSPVARLSPRTLAGGAAALYIVLQVLALTLPCRTYAWVAAATLVPYALFAIAAVGAETSRPDNSPRVRAITVSLALFGIVGGAAAAFGPIC